MVDSVPSTSIKKTVRLWWILTVVLFVAGAGAFVLYLTVFRSPDATDAYQKIDKTLEAHVNDSWSSSIMVVQVRSGSQVEHACVEARGVEKGNITLTASAENVVVAERTANVTTEDIYCVQFPLARGPRAVKVKLRVNSGKVYFRSLTLHHGS